MDGVSIQSLGAYGGLVSVIIHTLYGVYTALNHSRCRSNCCGIRSEVSLDVDKTDINP